MRDKHSSKKILVTITGLLVAIAASTALALTANSPRPARVATTPPAGNVKAVRADAYQLSYKGEDGKTALELLKRQAKIATKQSSLGEYIDAINGVNGGTDGKYWIFYVNGQMSSVGAGSYITKTGDNIEWKFQ